MTHLVLPPAPSAGCLRVDGVLEDGALVTEQVGPRQLEARGLGESLDEAVHQVPEVGVELALALLGDGGAQPPDDGEDEHHLEVDRVHLGARLLR